MHECETCGQMCDGDGDDLDCPQPANCDHLTGGECDADDKESPYDDEESPERTESGDFNGFCDEDDR